MLLAGLTLSLGGENVPLAYNLCHDAKVAEPRRFFPKSIHSPSHSALITRISSLATGAKPDHSSDIVLYRVYTHHAAPK